METSLSVCTRDQNEKKQLPESDASERAFFYLALAIDMGIYYRNRWE